MRRDEILEHREPFSEIRNDRPLDDFSGRLGHETAHTGKLLHLRAVAAGAGIDHHEYGVHVLAAVVVFERPEECIGKLLAGMRPDVLHLVLALAVRDDAATVLLLHLADLPVSFFELGGFLLGNDHVRDTNGDARLGGGTEAQFLETIERIDRSLLTDSLVASPNDVGELFLAADLVVESEFDGPDLIENHAAQR